MTVILIITIILFSVIGSAIFKVYGTTTTTNTQFNDLIDSIKNAKDGELTKSYIQLPEDTILISFTDGENFKKDKLIDLTSDCNYNVQVPQSCGNYPCICMCDSSWKYGYEDACVENGQCVAFTEDEITSFYDIDCPSGIFRKSSGVEFYFKKEGSILRFCKSKECVSKEDEEIANSFSNFIDTYKSCVASTKNDCICPVDYSFLTEGYSVNLYADHADLYNYKSKNIITTKTLETTPAVYENTQFTTLISLYRFELVISTGTEADAYYSNNPIYYVMSPSIETINAYDIETNQVIAQPYFYKNNNVYFTSKDLSKKESCTPGEAPLFV